LFICIALFSSAQGKDPYKKLVDSLVKAAQKVQLICYFEKELKKKPKDDNVLRYLGGIYLLEQNTEKVEYYYNLALQVNPSCARCYYKLGIVSVMKNENAKGLENYDKAIKLDPKQAEFYVNRAKLRESGRDKFRASDSSWQ